MRGYLVSSHDRQEVILAGNSHIILREYEKNFAKAVTLVTWLLYQCIYFRRFHCIYIQIEKMRLLFLVQWKCWDGFNVKMLLHGTPFKSFEKNVARIKTTVGDIQDTHCIFENIKSTCARYMKSALRSGVVCYEHILWWRSLSL